MERVGVRNHRSVFVEGSREGGQKKRETDLVKPTRRDMGPGVVTDRWKLRCRVRRPSSLVYENINKVTHRGGSDIRGGLDLDKQNKRGIRVVDTCLVFVTYLFLNYLPT